MNLKNNPNTANSMLAGMAAHVIQKACNELTKSCSPILLPAFVEFYTRFNTSVIAFQVVSQRLDGFVSLKQLEIFSKPVHGC